MNTKKRNGFTKVEIIIAVAVVVAVLAATLIPTFVSIANNNKAQEQTQKDLEQLAQQLEAKKNPLTLEEIEEKIAAQIAGIKLPEGVTAEDVNKAIADAIAGIEIPEAGLTSEQVEAIIDGALANLDSITQEDVEEIVNGAIAGIEIPEAGLTADEIKAIVDEALKGIDTGVTSEEVAEIVDAAIKNLELPEAGISAEEAEQIIAEALSKLEIPEAGLTAEEVEKIIADAIAGIVIPEPGLSAEEVEKIVADALAKLEIPAPGLSAEEVKKIVADAIAGIELPEAGLTAAEVEKIVADALAKIEIPAPGLSAEEVEKLIADAIEKALADLKSTVEIDDLVDWNEAIADPTVTEIVLNTNITLPETYTVEKDLTIDLNGNQLRAPANPEYPDSIMINVADEAEVTVKNGVFVDPYGNLNGGFDFFIVGENSVLNLENCSVAIDVTAEVIYNGTMGRWQTNSATHRIFVLDSNATVNLVDTDITVLAPKTSNINNYARYKFSVVGVHFARNSTNAKFVMDGGSFTMQVTDPNATKGTIDYTDTLYFVKSERVTGTLATASNVVELKGDAKVVIGEPNEEGELHTTNNLFYLGAGYYNGNTYYSGVKSFKVGAEVDIDLNGVCYSMNADAEWDLEGFCQQLGSSFANNRFDNVTEIEYHFHCSDYGYGCTFEADLTLSEIPTKCPQCGKGHLVIQ